MADMADTDFTLSHSALGRLMPMHLWICPHGTIRSAGPTLQKIFAAEQLLGRPFLECFDLHRPRGLKALPDLKDAKGMHLQVSLAAPPHTALRALVVPLAQDQGSLLNLSFGIKLAEAVADHALTNADFAPTDLTIEMLYLIEARTIVLEELRALNQRLQGAKIQAEEQALTDMLTGLRNRRGMHRALSAAAEGRQAFGLMHLDLDHFKAVNDAHGHAAGDHVLQQVAAILIEETRDGDTVARIGGDEFVIILPGVTEQARLETVGQRILRGLSQPIDYHGHICQIAGSIGTTLSRSYDPPLAEQMLIDSDRALYESKRRGRGILTAFTPGLSTFREPSGG